MRLGEKRVLKRTVEKLQEMEKAFRADANIKRKKRKGDDPTVKDERIKKAKR